MNAVLDPEFWKERLTKALRHADARQAVFKTVDSVLWGRIAEAHARILAREVDPAASILDIGCGYGRLLQTMPANWRGDYLGVDLSLDLVTHGRMVANTAHTFLVGDFRTMGIPGDWDLGVFCSVRGMLERDAPGTWPALLARAKATCRRILILEFDPDDPGTILNGDAT